VREAEIDTWLSSAPAHLVRAVHAEAALALNEWRERITRPGEQWCLVSSGMPTRSIVAAAGRAALELAIIVASHRPP
jgi:hypothetical protein